MFRSQTVNPDSPPTFILAKTYKFEYFEDYRVKNITAVVENIFSYKADTY